MTTNRIVKFKSNDGELVFVNLSKAEVTREGSLVTVHFALDEEDLNMSGFDELTGDEADLEFEDMPDNFSEYLYSLPTQEHFPVHPTEGSWKYWAFLDDGNVTLFW